MEDKKTRLIYSSIDNGYTYSDYKEWCEDNGVEAGNEWSWDYLNWKADQVEVDYEDLIENIKYSKNNGRCIISGSLGLWWGSPQIAEVVCESLVDAIKKCNRNDYLEVYESDEGYVEVHSIHHDGTNVFTIRPVNGRGRGKDNDTIANSENVLWYAGKYPKYLY